MGDNGLETEFSTARREESRYKGTVLSKICIDRTRENLLFCPTGS